MSHPPREHTWYECKCNKTGCMFCDGGLGACTVCGGFEGTLSTECAGRELHPNTLNAIWKGHIDYRDGRWVTGERWWDGKLHTWKEWAERKKQDVTAI